MSDSMTVEGTVQHVAMGTGAWALNSSSGRYEIYQGKPAEAMQDGLRVRARGKVRDDVMTLAMIGPVFEIESFEVLE
ncbi:MAG: hypothetical protein VKK04_05860 [Synechococcales bacterium]|nr:hypothetical protein [Synechococcales bacterium]